MVTGSECGAWSPVGDLQRLLETALVTRVYITAKSFRGADSGYGNVGYECCAQTAQSSKVCICARPVKKESSVHSTCQIRLWYF